FDNLPTAASNLPERPAREEPAPGSRRALRAARGSTRARDTQSDAAADRPAAASEAAPVAARVSETPSSEPTAPVAAERLAESTPLDDLFAPERHHSAPPKKRGRGCLIGLIIVLVVLGGIAAGGAWVYNTYQTKIDDLMGW